MKGRVRQLTGWLASPRLAAVLLLATGVMSFIGTLVPQGRENDAAVSAWRAANPALEPLVSAVGLHQAFASPVFVGTVLLLAASTAVCAWRRTKVGMRRYRLLSAVTAEDAGRLIQRPTFTIDVRADASDEPIEAAASALRGMGLHVSEREGMVVAASRPWTALASPVFHWAILLLILVIVGGRLNRFEGIMGVPVGDSRPLAAESFGFIDAGGLHSFPSSPNLIRVDRLDLSYPVDGIDRGPAPTVSIVRPDGSVAASHVIYPNSPLRYGSLIIHPGETGLSPGFAIVSREGSEGARTNLLVDFVGVSPSGTSSAQFTLTAPVPADSIAGTVTVPLAKRGGAFVEAAPNPAKATFTLGPLAVGAPIAEETLSVGQELKLPDGSSLRFLGLGHYARLGVVDDPSIPLIYGLLLVALAGLSVSILGAQSFAVVVVRTCEDGGRCMDVFFRDWRANTARVERAEEAIRGALIGQVAVIGDGR